MANIPAKHMLTKLDISIGQDQYTSHVQSANWTPSASSTSVTDVGGITHKFAGESGWDLDLVIFQDWTDTGLSTLLLEHEGEKVALTATQPDQATFQAEVTLVAPTIGGTGNQVAVATVKLPSSRPVRTSLNQAPPTPDPEG